MVDTTEEWIESRTGIRERRIAASDERTSDLAEHATRRALDAAGIEPQELDLIVVATTTPDHVFPSVACLLQDRLGIHNGGPAFDVQAVCAGFVYAIDVANRFFRTGASKRALVRTAAFHWNGKSRAWATSTASGKPTSCGATRTTATRSSGR